PEAGIRVYENYTAGSGRHAGDLAEMATASQEWHTLLSAPPAPRYAASTKACGIIDFLQSNPRHMFAKKAMSMLKDLGPAVCAEIAENPIVYYPNLFDKLYDSGLFNRQDLLKAANANDYLLGRITDRQAIQRRLDALNLDGIMSDMLHGYGEKGITDILFFGISSSGKTCILSGLLNNDGLSFDTVNFSCKYAQALKSYAEEGFAPPATRDVAVAVIKASTSRKGLKYHFNLVDMAGEAFVHKIADNIDAKTDFRDMGQGAPEVLNNGNDKVFFIVVDPAASPDDQTLQRNVLRRLIGLFFGSVNNQVTNRTIMERVRGIHFIVSKADTLPEPRLENARAIVRRLLNNQDCSELVENCRNFGINVSKDPALDGKPRIFCFSLGQFTVGNIYDYRPVDSETILQTICDYASGTGRETFLYKIRAVLTESLF
ncbi:MAG: hypothetical protein K2F79_04395, partial [Muribaculaceae bacterium]|nr:hypothetical protein [Muribaculaceae bacterium]